MAFQMLGAILLCTWLGKLLDSHFVTSKAYFAALGAFVGVCAGLYLALKDVIHSPSGAAKKEILPKKND
jgi:F0F1-type ATP synthase assembly protein I